MAPAKRRAPSSSTTQRPIELRSRRKTQSIELDAADLRIIELLTEDGRMSNRALGDIVGLTEATIAARIRSLQDHHILGISAIFDWEAAGYHWDLQIEVRVESRAVLDVAERIARLPYVHRVMMVFGDVDIMVNALLPDRDSTT